MTKPADRDALLAHILPFALWLFLMELLPRTAWAYGIRSMGGILLLAWYRPWRYYSRPLLSNPWLSILVGVGVFVIWVSPELPLWQRWPGWSHFYNQWCIFPPWDSAPPSGIGPYAPQTAGWPLAFLRLLGSALVIAPIEEFFWRGFLYRWLVSRNFLQVDLGRFQTGVFWMVALLFALEHNRWLVGLAAGAAYGWLMLRSRSLGAPMIAHMTTNFLLGIYVLATGSFQFWH